MTTKNPPTLIHESALVTLPITSPDVTPPVLRLWAVRVCAHMEWPHSHKPYCETYETLYVEAASHKDAVEITKTLCDKPLNTGSFSINAELISFWFFGFQIKDRGHYKIVDCKSVKPKQLPAVAHKEKVTCDVSTGRLQFLKFDFPAVRGTAQEKYATALDKANWKKQGFSL
jgi:hypothetical protein